MNKEIGRIQFYKNIFRTNKTYVEIEAKIQANIAREFEEEEALYLYAMVPVLVEYVTWVLTEAVKSGKKRLYFLARDGYQMYLVAKKLVKIWNMDLECRYLSVSRFAMRVPEYHLLEEACLERIGVGGIDVTFEKICRRAALKDDEIREIAKICGWEKEYQRVLNYQEVLQLKEVLKKTPEFMNRVYAYSKKAYPNAMGYLKQEGLLDDVPFALVDSGWVGTLQLTIQRLIQTQKPEIQVEGYYFGMYEYPRGAKISNYHTFYFSPTNGLRKKVYFSNCLFEAVFSAPEGMTLFYERVDEKYRPVLDLKENPNVKQLQKCIHILEQFLQYYDGIKPNNEDLDLVAYVVKNFMGHPTEVEVRAYGSTLFSDDVLEGHLQKVSAELSQEEIRKQRFLSKVLIMTGIRKDVIHESAWIEGSIINNKVNVAWNLRHAHFYKYFIYIRKWIQQGGKRELFE